MDNPIKIGTIKVEGETARCIIYWDGTALCDERGGEIMDGEAHSLEDAQELAAHLWELPCWDYQEE